MENINKETSLSSQFSLSINVAVPNTVVNINQKYVQEALQQIINELFRSYPEALNGKSPEEIREKLNISSIPKNTGKWEKFLILTFSVDGKYYVGWWVKSFFCPPYI